jgi:hypothetical protein
MDKFIQANRRAEMFTLIEKWQTSGLSQLNFCKENQITISLFNYWLKRYREETLPVGFAPINMRKGKLYTDPCS